jgi:hypothetical protein
MRRGERSLSPDQIETEAGVEKNNHRADLL